MQEVSYPKGFTIRRGHFGSTTSLTEIGRCANFITSFVALILSWWLSLGTVPPGEANVDDPARVLDILFRDIFDECEDQEVPVREMNRAIVPLAFYQSLLEQWIWTCKIPFTFVTCHIPAHAAPHYPNHNHCPGFLLRCNQVPHPPVGSVGPLNETYDGFFGRRCVQIQAPRVKDLKNSPRKSSSDKHDFDESK